jgi:hypothetical protein
MTTRPYLSRAFLFASLALGAALLGQGEQSRGVMTWEAMELLSGSQLHNLREVCVAVCPVNERTFAAMDEARISLEDLIHTTERYVRRIGMEVCNDRDHLAHNGVTIVKPSGEPADGIVGVDLDMLVLKDPKQYVFHISLGIFRDVSVRDTNLMTLCDVWETECLDAAQAGSAATKVKSSLRHLLKELEKDWLNVNARK